MMSHSCHSEKNKIKNKNKNKNKTVKKWKKIQQKTYHGPKLTLNCQKLKLKKGTN